MTLSPEITELFYEKCPRYSLLLGEWIKKGSSQEKREENLNLKVPAETEVFYLYGLADAIPRAVRNWLNEKESHRLIFLEPNPARIVEFLQTHSAAELLGCKQVKIIFLPEGAGLGEVLQELAETHPLRGVQIESFWVADRRKFVRVKNSLLRKTALTHAHYLERLHGHIPFSHLIKNLPRMADAFYANGLKDAFAGIPAVICGAGPSLAASLDVLRTLERRALILAGGSAIAVLSHHGITPHFCLAIDPNPDELQRVQNRFSLEAPLLFSSRLFPDCFSVYKGPLGYLRSGMAGIPELWFEEQLGLVDPILGAKLPSEALSVTTLAAAFAYHLGCNPILFEGIDLAYTENRRYADGVFAEESDTECLQPIDRKVVKRSKKGESVRSAVRWVMEARALSRFSRSCKDRRWINCTQGGLGLKGVEACSLNEVLFEREWDLRERIRSAILKTPMPNDAHAILREKREELHKSIQAVIVHLTTLVQEKNFGRRVLAELELKEELAYAILFFECEKAIRIALGEVDERAYWAALLEMAKRYDSVLASAPYS